MADVGRGLSNSFFHVDLRNPLPLYAQLKQSLREQVARGHWKPGDVIPPRPECCRRRGVSRTVVRQALTELALEGLIARERGRAGVLRGLPQSGTLQALPRGSGQLIGSN